MELFWKAAAGTLLAVILILTVEKREKDMAVLLGMAVCAMVGIVAIGYLKPVLELIWELGSIGALQEGMLGILLKAVGIALISEMAGGLCADAGSGSLGKALQMVGSGAVLCLSVPVFRDVLTVIQEILGAL